MPPRLLPSVTGELYCNRGGIFGIYMRIPKLCVCLSIPREKKSPYLRQYQSYSSIWYINGKVFTSTTAGKPKKKDFVFKKGRNWILTCTEVLKSPLIHQYQSYSSNWYMNGEVFTSTTTWKSKKFILKKLSKLNNEFWLVPKCWNHPSFVNISPTVVIDESMERSSWVL